MAAPPPAAREPPEHQAPGMAAADILGLSCRFPESASPAQFWQHLAQGDDMVTANDSRWPVGLHGTPPRTGKVPDYDKFDASFFSVHGKQAQKMDPQMRKLLEVSWEAWMDSGIDVGQLRGSCRVGVYIGCCGSEVHAAWLADVPNITGYEQTGCTQSMFANRLSWTYDFRGPSKAIDTACSSSALALHDAVADLTAGRCDWAMVGGASSILRPSTSVAFNKLHMLSPDGSCKSFSSAANGYVRADGIAVLILRRADLGPSPRWAARQPYAQIVNIGTNNDGHTKEGITFPSADAQGALARQVCRTAGVQPSQVGYVEAHGTGTVAGDGQELGAIDSWYGSAAGRTPERPLLLGSVKSNMGHCEGASGLAGVIKLCLAYEHGTLPGNLHYSEPNPGCESLKEGTLKVVAQATAWEGGYAALSSFGFGGSNVHMLLHGRPAKPARRVIAIHAAADECSLAAAPAPAPEQGGELARLVPLAGRTPEGLATLATALKEQEGGLVLPMRSLANSLAADPHKFGCRGTLLDGELRSATAPSSPPQVWFVFSGNGGQWPRMALSLLRSEPRFRASIEACAAILAGVKVDLMGQFAAEAGFRDPMHSAVGLACVQIALVDLLTEQYGIKPDGMLGHSAGEMACGYASGCLTREQTVLLAYHRGRLPVAHALSGGLMAATGLSAADAFLRVAGTDCVLACDNSPSSTTLSGPAEDIRRLVAELQAEGVFVREVDTLGVAFHSPALEPLLPELRQEVAKLIPKPRARPASWVSTSFPANATDEAACLCSAEYHVHSFRNRVLFTEAVAQVPEGAVAIEIGPHSLMRAAVRQCRPQLGYVGLMRKGECGLATLAAALGELWRKGAAVQWPADAAPDGLKAPELPRAVRDALVSWDHAADYPLPKMTGAGAGAFTKSYELGGEHAFLADHKIDGRILMPATSYLVTAWDALATQMGKPMGEVPVEWADVSVFQAVQADAGSTVTLSVLLDRSQRFQVLSGTDLIAEGRVKPLPAAAQPTPKQPASKEGEAAGEAAAEAPTPLPEWALPAAETVASDAFYRDCGRMGLNYGPKFRMVQAASVDGSAAHLRWDGCYIRFLDGVLQASGLTESDHQLRIPVRLRSVKILDPSPSIPLEAPVAVTVDQLCGTVACALCEVAGLELSLVPKRPLPHTLQRTRMAWLPYGERDSADAGRAAYAGRVAGLLRARLLPELQARESLAPPLQQVMEALQQLPEASMPDAAFGSSQPLAASLLEAIEAAEPGQAVQAAQALLADGARLAELCQGDQLLAGFRMADLQPLLDTAMENFSCDGYAACEVGAGTGFFAKQALGELNSSPATDLLRYVATDASDAATALAAAVPSPKLSFQEWDVKQPPPPALEGPFDLVLSSHGLSRAQDVPGALANLCAALAPKGFLLLHELAGPLAAALWGLAQPAEAGQAPPARSVAQWRAALTAAGLHEVMTLRCPGGGSALMLFRKLDAPLAPALPVQMVGLRASAEAIDAWLEGFKAAQEQAEGAQPADAGADAPAGAEARERSLVWVHGDAGAAPGTMGFLRSARKELRGEALRMVSAAGASPPAAQLVQRCRRLDLFANLFVDGRHGCYRSILLQGGEAAVGDSSPHGCHLDFAAYGDLASLQWVENAPIPASLQQHLVACDVTYGALNFRDVMLAYGKLSRDLMAHGKGGDYIGLEFAGRVCGSTRRVMGVAQQAIATRISTQPVLLWDVPAAWSLAEAASVPVAYTTAYYALVTRGRLRPHFSVLIHSGSGAVGLAAIQICLARGCQVFTTCGSEAKKRFLLDAFPGLQAANIGDSRSCSFEAVVMRGTGGRGVRLVLNSLADDKLQASVRCLGNRGRLLEIGKYDILKGTPLSMRPLLRNIAFDGIDLDRVFNDPEDPTEIQEVHRLMADGIASGEVRPLPVTIFARAQAGEAFRFMATGTHIGKCMVAMQPGAAESGASNCLGPRSEQAAGGSALTEQPAGRTLATFSCREDRSYILTGGLGGFGLALAEWLAQKGAKHILLTSKRGLRTGAQARAIAELRKRGVQVEVSTLDVSDLGQTRAMVRLAGEMAPPGAIFHLAMQITDRLLANQSGESWNGGVVPKAIGGHNLDAASRGIDTLEHFVMFSSIVATAGNEGQTNYGYANSSLDVLCEARAAEGLPALSVQWGIIGHVGFVEEAMNGKMLGRLAEISLAQPVDDCLAVLGGFLADRGCGPVVTSSWKPANLLGGGQDGDGKDLMTAILDIMGLQPGAVSDSDSLAAMGIDSMQLVEVRAAVQRALGRPLPLEEIGTMTMGDLKALSGGTPGSKAAKAAKSTPAKEAPAAPAAPAQPEGLKAAEAPLAAGKAGGKPSGLAVKPPAPEAAAPGTPEQAESPKAKSAAPAPASQGSAPAAAAAAAEAQPEAAPRDWTQLRWSLMSNGGMLLVGVFLCTLAAPAFRRAAALATALGPLAALPLLPLVWLALCAAACLACVAAKRLLQPPASEQAPVALWSADFARWWLSHRLLGTTSHLFARHLRGTPFLPAFLRALGARIGAGAFIDSLDFMDPDLLQLGSDVAVGEGATLTGHAFRGGRLHFSKVRIGDGCVLQPFAVATGGLSLPAGTPLPPLCSRPALAGQAAAQEPAAELQAALAAEVQSRELSAAATAAAQVAGLYSVQLLSAAAAYAAFAALAHAGCLAGLPAELALHPAGFATAAMVCMTSPLFLAFLPLLLPVHACLSGAGLQALALTALATPAALVLQGALATLLAAGAKRLLVGRLTPGVHRRASLQGVRFWLSQRLVEAAYSAAGSPLIGTWAACAFYRLFAARVGRGATFRYGNVITAPDMLTVGDWAHVGDTANVVTSMPLDSQRLLLAPVAIKAQALLGVSSVVLPGTTVEAGASIGALCAPAAGGRTQPGMIHLGSPARAMLKAAPGSNRGEQPEGAAAVAAALLPVAHAAGAAALTVLAAAPAAAAGAAFAAAGGAVLGAAAAAGAYAFALVQLSAGAKAALVGTLAPGAGIRKYSPANLARGLAWALETRALDLWAEAGRGSAGWNAALRARGLALAGAAYIDSAWPGDYELASYSEGAVVDRGATVFAHLGLYRGGELRMEQAPVAIGAGAVVGPRSAVLPGAQLADGATLAAGQLAMKAGF